MTTQSPIQSLGLNYLGKSALVLLFAAGLSTAAMAADAPADTSVQAAKDSAGATVQHEATSVEHKTKIADKTVKKNEMKKDEVKKQGDATLPAVLPSAAPPVTK